MATNSKIEIAFVWTDIRKPSGGADYFLLDVLRSLRFINFANYEISVKVYDINDELSLIKELNNHDIVVMNSLNKSLALIPFINVPVLIDVHYPDWLQYFREKELGIKPRPGARLRRGWLRFLGRRVYCRVLNKFDYEVFSKYCKEVFLIPNFIDTKIFYPSASKAKDFTVIIRYDEYIKNGFHIFLKALKFLGKSRWLNIVIIGKEPPHSILRVIHQLSNDVVTLGRVANREQLVNIYSMAHTTIIPSLYESFSLIALESLACGTPIIMSRLPPIAWYLKEITIKSPGTGLAFQPANPLDLAEKIRIMYEIWSQYGDIYYNSIVTSRKIAEKFDVKRILPIYLKTIINIANKINLK
jgi:glycosyltransferase involved in cell wall biosynthesis